MSLENLLKIGRLHEHETTAREVIKMLDAAKRAVKDAEVEGVSAETRFDAAYRAIMQSATVALWAHGYRPATSTPGHHQTTTQSLVHTVDLPRGQMAVLDRLRNKRNVADYTGEDIDDGSVEVCVEHAQELIDRVENWLTDHHPSLLDL